MWYVNTAPTLGGCLTGKVATAKGLIAGNFVLRRQDGTCIHGLSEEEVSIRLSVAEMNHLQEN